MKKIGLILLIMIASFTGVHAQSTMAQTDPAGASATVNTNADTSYHTINLAGSINDFKTITVAVAGTKTSGTVGGAATLWGSIDGSRWFAVYAQTNASGADTTHSQSLSNGDNDIVWIVTGTKYKYYRVRVITTGTQVSSYVARLFGRKN